MAQGISEEIVLRQIGVSGCEKCLRKAKLHHPIKKMQTVAYTKRGRFIMRYKAKLCKLSICRQNALRPLPVRSDIYQAECRR